MTATSETQPSGVTATTSGGLRFDVIDSKAAKILGIGRDEVTDESVGGLVGASRETISRWRNGRTKPSFPKLLEIGHALGLAVEDFTARAGE